MHGVDGISRLPLKSMSQKYPQLELGQQEELSTVCICLGWNEQQVRSQRTFNLAHMYIQNLKSFNI